MRPQQWQSSQQLHLTMRQEESGRQQITDIVLGPKIGVNCVLADIF